MEEKKKNHFVSVRFSTEEKEELKKIAAAHQKTLSEMVRAVTLESIGASRRRFVPEINRKLYFELGKVSEQIRLNETSSSGLNSLQELLNQIRRELLGLDP
jgi:hypothetical protein